MALGKPHLTAEEKYPPHVGVLVAERLLVAGLRAHERAEESEATSRRLGFLFRASQQLAASLEPATTIQSLVELVVAEFGDACIAHVLESGRQKRQATRASSEALRPWLCGGAWDWLNRVTRRGVNRVVRSAKPELGGISGRRRKDAVPAFGAISYMTVPLVARGRTLGALSIFSLISRELYGPEDLVVGEALGAQAGLALENARLYEEQRGIVQRLALMRSELDAAQSERLRDDERRRIARELHDHVEQTFFAIGLRAQAALEGPRPDEPMHAMSESLVRVGELATTGAEQLRAAIFALNNAEFAAQGLVPALWSLVRTFRQRTGIEADLVLTGTQRPVPTVVAEALHAMAREALANVERHARAGTVVLGLHITARFITLSIHDDGAGVSPLVLKHISDSTTHFGLRGIRDRVLRSGGTLVAGAGPDGGFLVRARIPLHAGRAA